MSFGNQFKAQYVYEELGNIMRKNENQTRFFNYYFIFLRYLCLVIVSAEEKHYQKDWM
jgi:hypothetical protein